MELTEEEIVSHSRELTKKEGVYFLIDVDKIVYVGQSSNCSSRIRAHVGGKKFNRVYILHTGDRIALETKYINQFKPKYNRTIQTLRGEVSKMNVYGIAKHFKIALPHVLQYIADNKIRSHKRFKMSYYAVGDFDLHKLQQYRFKNKQFGEVEL